MQGRVPNQKLSKAVEYLSTRDSSKEREMLLEAQIRADTLFLFSDI